MSGYDGCFTPVTSWKCLLAGVLKDARRDPFHDLGLEWILPELRCFFHHTVGCGGLDSCDVGVWPVLLFFILLLYHMMGHRRVLLSVLVLVLRLPFASLGLASGGSHIQQNVDGVSGLIVCKHLERCWVTA
jgi:hypothetical protein